MLTGATVSDYQTASAGKSSAGATALPTPARLNVLTTREIEVLSLLCKGLTNVACSHQLQITQRTIELHRRNIMEKSRCRSAVELGVWAVRSGIVSAGRG